MTWARTLDDDAADLIDSMPPRHLTSVYLIEEDENAERALRRHWAWIFEEKLMSWCRDPQLWPRKRTYKEFQKWFEVHLAEPVFDLPEHELLREDL